MIRSKVYLAGIIVVLAALAAGLGTSGSCAFTRERKIVSGESLLGLIENNATVTLLRGYYKCHQTERGDVAAYHAGKPDLIIKIVAAVPGDAWSIEDLASGHKIIVNGRSLRNPAGEEYLIDDRAARMLNLYVRDYKGVIPVDAYLLLGTAISGAYDSTSIGLIGQSDIIGKIEF